MLDQYGRTIDYLRISITDRCNLRCVYCMPPEGVSCMSHEAILRYEEIEAICQAMAVQGLKHIKITGGEPLVRKGCSHLIRSLKNISGIETVTLTTNGILLEEMAEQLVHAGVDGINISLDTLDAKEYAQITRGGDINKVLRGLETILRHPNVIVKINCVLDENWEQTACSLAELAVKMPVHVRFIEHMPIGLGGDKEVRLQDQVKKTLENVYGPAKVAEKPMGFGPSVYYQFENFQGKIGFISAISHKFCGNCNRVRLTADGKLRLCLQSEDSIDLKTILRSDRKTELISVIKEAIWQKPREHNFDQKQIEAKSMAQIGG